MSIANGNQLEQMLINSGIISDSSVTGQGLDLTSLESLESLMGSTIRITDGGFSDIDDFKTEMADLVGILFADYYTVVSDADGVLSDVDGVVSDVNKDGKQEALAFIGYVESNIEQDEEEMTQGELEGRAFIKAGITGLLQLGGSLSPDLELLSGLRGDISEKINDVSTLETEIHNYLERDAKTLEGLELVITTSVKEDETLSGAEILKIEQTLISNAKSDLTSGITDIPDIPVIVAAISQTTLGETAASLFGHTPGTIRLGSTYGGPDTTGTMCGSGTAPTNTENYTVPQTYDWSGLSFNADGTLSGDSPPGLTCTNGNSGPVIISCNTSADPNVIQLGGCGTPQNNPGTCGATYGGVDPEGKTGTDKCTEKSNSSGFWNYFGWNYDSDYSLPSAVYNSDNNSESCSSNCQDMNKYEGIEECCDLQLADENFCTIFKNLANIKAGATNCNATDTDNDNNCPETWPESWADDTYWNDYLWISTNCDGEVVGGES